MDPNETVFWGPAEIPKLAAMGWYSENSGVIHGNDASYQLRTAFAPGSEINSHPLTHYLRTLANFLWEDFNHQSRSKPQSGLLSCPSPHFTIGDILHHLQKQLWVFFTLRAGPSEDDRVPELILGIPWSATVKGKPVNSDGWDILRSVSHIQYDAEAQHIELSGKWRDQQYVLHSWGRQILPFRSLYQALHTAVLLSSPFRERASTFQLAPNSKAIVTVSPPVHRSSQSNLDPQTDATDIFLALAIHSTSGISNPAASITLRLTPHQYAHALISAREELSGSTLCNGILYFQRVLTSNVSILYHQNFPLYLQPRCTKGLETLLQQAMNDAHLKLVVYVSNTVSTGQFNLATPDHARGSSFMLSLLFDPNHLLEGLEAVQNWKYVRHLQHAAILEHAKAFQVSFRAIRRTPYDEQGPVS